MPKGAISDALQQHIDRLAAEHGAPSFAPHVTLAVGPPQTEDEAVSITADLASRLKAYTLQLSDVSFGSIFHQCVYIRCKKTDAALAAARQAKEAIGQDPNVPYMPHLSLLYSDIDQTARSEVAGREQKRLFGAEGLPALSFDVDSIALWYTIADDKELKSWTLVKQFDLQK